MNKNALSLKNDLSLALAVGLTSLLTNFSVAFAADSNEPTAPAPSELIVVEATRDFRDHLNDLAKHFAEGGANQVVDSIAADLSDPQKRALWQQAMKAETVHVVSVEVHPNQQKAVAFLNDRFERMGIKNLKFDAVLNSAKPDPTQINEQNIKGRKWLRYMAGAGVAMLATGIELSHQHAQSASDYMLLVLPNVGVGVTTVLLELQFAWPRLNNAFWKHVWTFGGPVIGRVTNTVVNFLYGMALYGAGVGAAHIPVLFGGDVVPFQSVTFAQAMASAAIGGLIFHVAMGQYQTDISTEESRGSITAEQRYSRETTGVLVNNSARVLDWVVPLGIGRWAQAGFFALKTLPQLIKTQISFRLTDRRIRNEFEILKEENLSTLEPGTVTVESAMSAGQAKLRLKKSKLERCIDFLI